MSKADRITRQRAALSARNEALDKARAARKQAEHDGSVRQELAAIVPALLRRLEAAGAPDAVLVKVPMWSKGRGPKVSRAAWRVGTYTYWNRDSYNTGYLYLLSDGRLYAGGWPIRIGSATHHLDEYLKGIRRLAAQYP